MGDFLLYGANGYTAKLILSEAVVLGPRPILAGRNTETVSSLAQEFRLEHCLFAVDGTAAVEAALRGVKVVLNCAGPFVRTAGPIVDACLRTGTHYLDITGEVEVFEALAARDVVAQRAGVMLMPGVGFDVVPSDCLAAHLKRRLPTATRLALAIANLGGLSRGTATTIVDNLGHGGLVRRGGVLTRVPEAYKTRTIDFGEGPVQAISIAWGDVSTAYYSTGIPNIEVYMAAPLRLRVAARLSRYLGWALRTRLVRNFLKRRIQAGPPGPTMEERGRGKSLLWGEASNDAGGRVVSRLKAPEGYTLTARAALAVVERVLGGEAPPGFHTPSSVFGPDFVLHLPGVTRTDEG